MKNKKLWIAVVALIAVAAIMMGVYYGTRPQVEDDGKGGTVEITTTQPQETQGDTQPEQTQPEQTTPEYKYTITVTVVHKDGSSKDFTYQTNESYLGPVLTDSGLVIGENGAYGLYIQTVDGETADYNVDQGWWALYEGDNMAMTGADSVVLTDGGIYKLVYTVG